MRDRVQRGGRGWGHREMAPHASFVLGCGGSRTHRARPLPALLLCHRGIRVRAGARAADRRAAAARSRPPRRREPTPDLPPTGGEQPGTTGGQLPRTGWDALLYFALGVALLLAGARLRVVTRIREVVQRVRRRIDRGRAARGTRADPGSAPGTLGAGPRRGPAPRGAEHADRPPVDGRGEHASARELRTAPPHGEARRALGRELAAAAGRAAGWAGACRREAARLGRRRCGCGLRCGAAGRELGGGVGRRRWRLGRGRRRCLRCGLRRRQLSGRHGRRLDSRFVLHGLGLDLLRRLRQRRALVSANSSITVPPPASAAGDTAAAAIFSARCEFSGRRGSAR